MRGKLKGEWLAMGILIADDDEASSLYLELALRVLEHTTVSVRSGTEVLRMLEDFTFDAVILDIEMPDMGGIEAIERIRSQAHLRDLPVYAITAHTDGPEIAGIQQAGFSGYLSKPVSPEALDAILRGALPAQFGKAPDFSLVVDADVFTKYEELLRSAGMRPADGVQRTLEDVKEWLRRSPMCSPESREAAHSLAGSCAVIGAAALRGELKQLERLAAQATGLELWMQALERTRHTIEDTKHAYRALLGNSVTASGV